LLITARPEFKQPWPAYAHVANVTLGRIGREDVASLIEQVTGGKSLPQGRRGTRPDRHVIATVGHGRGAGWQSERWRHCLTGDRRA
jgi:hypothetical protein